MFKSVFNKSHENSLMYILLIIFILTELIDDFFDHILGNSIIHSVIQLFLFLILFFIVAKTFLGFYKRRINKLITEELMAILKIIKEAENNGVLINQKKMRDSLNITKPTMKKRVDSLIELKYIYFEKKGNNNYLRLTELGNSFSR